MNTADEYILHAIELAEIGRQREALNLLRHVTQRRPDSVSAWKWLAYLTPDRDEALWALRTIERLAPNDPWLRTAGPALLPRGYSDRPPRLPPRRTGDRPRRQGCLGALSATLVLVIVMAALLLAVGALLWHENRAIVETNVAALVELVATADVAGEASEVGQGAASPSTGPDAGLVPELSALVSDVQMTSAVEYYQFEAETLPEIQQGLYELGPSIMGDEHAIAVTTYRLWVEWEARQTSGACQMTDAVIHLDVAYTYPRWVPVGQPDPQLYDEWDRFIAHVTAHEQHHGALALDCAYTLADRLEQMDEIMACDMAEGQINALVDEVYAACEAQQAEFDRVEGRTTFPLP